MRRGHDVDKVHAFSLIAGRRSLAGSAIGGDVRYRFVIDAATIGA
ncbi:MAG TPA: hypothetical protein VF706_06020 [Solirubrobacteraceae bacterium]